MNSQANKKHSKSTLVQQALELLKTKPVDPKEALKLAKELKSKEQAFGYARKLLEHALANPYPEPDAKLRLELAQKLALCTYKDPDLSPDTRFDKAFEILNSYDSLDKTNDQETLGLAGAIYKRKWEYGNQKEHLERSLAYYWRGYLLVREKGWAEDQGYNAINAAFVLDLLAHQEAGEAIKAGIAATMAESRRAEADTIRNEIVTALPPLLEEDQHAWMNVKWWVLVTIGEAYFGLGKYPDASEWLSRADAIEHVPEWERESTARQIASLMRLRIARGIQFAAERQRAEQVLREFLKEEAALFSVVNGKIGLALSGGGFRASLYHIGVLARLAELDVLRHVEVVSCVSGGSIIGAQYYLEVKHLLESKDQQKITAQDYIHIVKKIEKDFLAGVQTNIRTSVASNICKILKMILFPGYSRTNRLGELYEERLFLKATGVTKPKLFMDELFINPFGARNDFIPKYHNWKRSAKVPILILNATTLNTGHNWQFTASWMGEPPAGTDGEIDANLRLRRMYYEDAPEKFQKIRLGDAVAASSCVPGLFEPLPLSGLYPEITVRLVDGGVHDNQGSVGLLDQNCDVMLVSDASGQMASDRQPENGLFKVLLRAKSILEERVRISQYMDLDARRLSGLLKGLMFIHLKKELAVQPVDWIGCQDPSPDIKNGPVTGYGINRKCQEALAAIRTDLDSFTNNEARSLMLSGYRMTWRYFPLSMPAWPVIKPQISRWEFIRVNSSMKKNPPDSRLLTQLRISSMMAFKVWMLLWPLKVLAGLLGLLLLYFCYEFRCLELYTLTLGALLTAFAAFVVNRIFGSWVWKLFNYSKTLKEIAMGVILVSIGWIVALLHLHIFDRLYLRVGKRP